jgi:hypothetical protein
MCVYCKEAPACDHERDACAASLGERCIQCGHSSTAFLAYTPGRERFNWPPAGLWPKRKPLKKAARSRQAKAKKAR